MKDRIVLVVHGHFYQPPRENPWTDEFESEAGAAPFANWNERIDAECYRANSYARIYDGKDRTAAMVNNFAALSFNVGPTLGRWLERHDPHVARRIRSGNDEQKRRLPAGGALAQVWSHAIAPLLSPRDLRTQIVWGMHDFHRRYGYTPSGMWLPETAANDATLGALIDAGIAFTILAPEQIKSVRPPDGSWREVNPATLDSGRPYRFLHPDGSGRHLSLCIFDGPLSRELAFGGATRDAKTFLSAVERTAQRSTVTGPQLVLAASDGELYGHHKKFADLTLAYAFAVEATKRGIEVSNLESFLAGSPPTWEARLQPGQDGRGTAWSCSHGLGRWLRDCGCRMNALKNKSQAWRAPLRQAVDCLRDRAAELFAQKAGQYFADPWQARDDYGSVVDEPAEIRRQFLRKARQAVAASDATADRDTMLLMEMQRSLLLMYTSCAWFFDDIAGGESAIALARAAHAMDLWRALGGQPPEQEFLAHLAKAQSNEPKLGTGADAFARAVGRRVTCEHVLARAAFSRLVARGHGPHASGFALTGDDVCDPGSDGSIEGRAEVIETRTGLGERHQFRAGYDEAGRAVCEIDGRVISPLSIDPRLDVQLKLRALAGMAIRPMNADRLRAMSERIPDLASDGERAAMATLLMQALSSYLDACCLQEVTDDENVWSAALLLCERALPHTTPHDLRRTQDLVWEHLDGLKRRHASVPRSLQLLAERVDSTRRARDARSKSR